MLYVPDKVQTKLDQLMEEAATGDRMELARRLLAVLPGYGPAYLLSGNALFAAGKLDEAEAVFWEGLQHQPCGPTLYLNLAQVRTDRDEGDVLAKRLRYLALWKLSFADEIPEYVAKMFTKLVGDEAYEPETYERLARYEDVELEKVRDSADVVRRLLPYRLLNDLQREAPDDLSAGTLRGIITEQADLCEPILRGALRQWAQEEGALDDFSASLLIAILGEISGPDAVDELLELATIGNDVMFPHVHWAIARLGMRYPQEVLERFRAAARGADVKLRCALADQIDLLEDVEGDVEALVSLLDGFEELARQEDAAYILAQVVRALMERDQPALAKSLAARYESKLGKKDRRLVGEALKMDGDFTSVLLDMGIDAPDIEGVCLERCFLSNGEGEEEEDKEDVEDDFDDPVDLEPPPPKPGRNDPCWCGSGKKYKKCHLAADEEAEREQAASEAEEGGDEPADTLHGQLMAEVLKAAREWHTPADVERAKKLYFDAEGKLEVTDDDINGFMEWLLHDFRDARTGRTAIENYLRTRAQRLTRLEREHLESLRDARYALFEVERIEPGSGVNLHDLGAGDRMFVHDISMSNSLKRGKVVLARIQFEDGRWLFAGSGNEVPANRQDAFMKMIEEESRRTGQVESEFIRANSHRLHRMANGVDPDWMAGLKIVNNEGEDFEFGKAEYQVRDEAALLAVLRAVEDLEEEPSGNPGTPAFVWLQPVGGSHRLLGRVTITGGVLLLEAQSRTRLRTGRGLLESHAGEFLKHIGDSYTGMEEIKKTAMSGQRNKPRR